MNKIIVMGRLAQDPEIKYTEGDKGYARFSLVVSQYDGTAQFYPCIAFGKKIENIEKYLKKGVKILLEGSISYSPYKSKEGKTMYNFNVVINTWEFAESKKSDKTTDDNYSEDGLPFN